MRKVICHANVQLKRRQANASIAMKRAICLANVHQSGKEETAPALAIIATKLATFHANAHRKKDPANALNVEKKVICHVNAPTNRNQFASVAVSPAMPSAIAPLARRIELASNADQKNTHTEVAHRKATNSALPNALYAKKR